MVNKILENAECWIEGNLGVKAALVCSIQIEYSFNLYFFFYFPHKDRGGQKGDQRGVKKRDQKEVQKRGPGYMYVYIPKNTHM